jgi:LacI family transcriptional regulator
MSTIRDLARKAGVSVATVSRALNQYPDIRAETRTRILRLAREMGFQPSLAARSLVTRRSPLIGVFLRDSVNSDLADSFATGVLARFKEKMGPAGFDLLLFANEKAEEGLGELSYVKRCQQHRVAGVLLLGVDQGEKGVLELGRSKIPCISVDSDLFGPRAGYVMSNNAEGARQAVRHLYRVGHRRIALIAGRHRSRTGHDRSVGYRQELTSLGLPYNPDYVRDGDSTAEGGYAAVQALLALSHPPTAVFAAGDLMAAGAMAAVYDCGLRVPDDLAVVGFDDLPLAALIRPALTTVRQDMSRLGAAAAETLMALISETSTPPPAVQMKMELVVRHSCGAGRAQAGTGQAQAGAVREGGRRLPAGARSL